ncbi:MAG: histidine phosphatase family protein [Ignavibacteria bacterium]|nr:histidine phosphatase family protein [Ignavibacteria bacterium]
MKKLFLIRHAKSSWKHPELSDHDRPLNKRGKHDAELMSETLKARGIKPDIIVTSSAVRALEFAKVISDILNCKKPVISEKLYLASESGLLGIVKETDEKYNTVFLIGHNPGITYFANLLSGSSIENIPTSGIAEIGFSHCLWKEIQSGSGELLSFDYPKKHYL